MTNYFDKEKQEDMSTSFEDVTPPLYRALAKHKQDDIQFVFSNNEKGRRFEHEKPLLYLRNAKTLEEQQFLRGQIDHFSLLEKYQDEEAFYKYAPEKSNEHPSQAYDFFQSLEHLRCEAIGSKHMSGMASNLRYRAEKLFLEEDKTKPFRERTATEKREIAFNLLMMEKLTKRPLNEKLNFYAQPFRTWLDEILPETTEEALYNNLEDPTLFYKNSLSFLKEIFPEISVPEEEVEPGTSDPNQDANHVEDDAKEEQEAPEENTASTPQEEEQSYDSSDQQTQDSTEPQAQEQQEETSLSDIFDDQDLNADEEEEQGERAGSYTPPTAQDDSLFADYDIYTDQFDEIVRAEDLIDPLELKMLNKSLANLSKDFRGSVQKIGIKLKRFLMAQKETSWQFDQEEGYLDPSRLARIVANPTTPLAFKHEKQDDMMDTAVTILVDNSGSMRGRPIVMAATCTDVLASTLEQCGVKTEILGFTTCAWKGGRAREDWMKNGKPYNPGRLSDLRHIIYKPFEKRLRTCQDNFGLMLREGILKENIDGEAVIWAYKRLLNRSEKRKILIVISDGAPVDDSTASANHAKILDQHLRHVVTSIIKEDRIELNAVGIGHDVTRLYPDSIYIKSAEELATTLANRLVLLFADKDSPATKRMIEKVKRSS